MKVMESAMTNIRQETRGRESWEGYYPPVFKYVLSQAVSPWAETRRK